jgi:hypothetical protein
MPLWEPPQTETMRFHLSRLMPGRADAYRQTVLAMIQQVERVPGFITDFPFQFDSSLSTMHDRLMAQFPPFVTPGAAQGPLVFGIPPFTVPPIEIIFSNNPPPLGPGTGGGAGTPGGGPGGPPFDWVPGTGWTPPEVGQESTTSTTAASTASSSAASSSAASSSAASSSAASTASSSSGIIITKNLIWNEEPTGTIDGINTIFTLVHLPLTAKTAMVFLNGILQGEGDDFALVGDEITFAVAPVVGDKIRVTYETAE